MSKNKKNNILYIISLIMNSALCIRITLYLFSYCKNIGNPDNFTLGIWFNSIVESLSNEGIYENIFWITSIMIINFILYVLLCVSTILLIIGFILKNRVLKIISVALQILLLILCLLIYNFTIKIFIIIVLISTIILLFSILSENYKLSKNK